MANFNPKSPFEQLRPYLVLGISIAILVGLFILLSYVLVWGLIIGVILWGAMRISRLFHSQPPTPPRKQGRVIEHEDE